MFKQHTDAHNHLQILLFATTRKSSLKRIQAVHQTFSSYTQIQPRNQTQQKLTYKYLDNKKHSYRQLNHPVHSAPWYSLKPHFQMKLPTHTHPLNTLSSCCVYSAARLYLEA